MKEEKILYAYCKALLLVLLVIGIWGLFDKKVTDGIAGFLIAGLWIMAFSVSYSCIKLFRSHLSHQMITIWHISTWGGILCTLLNIAANVMRPLRSSVMYTIAAYVFGVLTLIFAGTSAWIFYRAYKLLRDYYQTVHEGADKTDD